MLQERLEDNILIATLANGHTNPITQDMLRQLADMVQRVNAADGPKGLILTGEGRFFSSGFDLPLFMGFKDLAEAVAFFEFEEQILTDFFACRKPVVVAMNGHGVAGGLIFALAADYRIVKNHPKIKIGMSEIKIGLPLSIAQMAVVRFGLDSDIQMRNVLFSGNMMDVTKAREMGIVDEVVEEEDLLPRAKQVVCNWIDTPNRPFMIMKEMWKASTVAQIQAALKAGNWQNRMNCFFQEDVRNTLAFVQAGMEQKK